MGSSGSGRDEQLRQLAELTKTLKKGERILAPTRRPDGTFRKPIRIRSGYIPQDEVAIYQSKGTLWKKEMAALQMVPPGYDPVTNTKPKSKSVKKSERKKEKRLPAALDAGKSSEPLITGEEPLITGESTNAMLPHKSINSRLNGIEAVVSRMDELSICRETSVATPPMSSKERDHVGNYPDIDKRIRALKKKIRLVEAQQQKSEQLRTEIELEKFTKLEGWRKELKILEFEKAGNAVASSS